MTIEEILKSLILDRYGSVREFTIRINMPYSTFDTILRRGIQNSTVSNIITICQELQISADALAEGKIVPVNNNIIDTSYRENSDLDRLVNRAIDRLIDADNLTLNGKPVDQECINCIIDGVKIGLELAKRRQKQKSSQQKP